jgi:TPR repeat protein
VKLGNMYEYGDGVPKSLDSAKRYYLWAMEAYNPLAIANFCDLADGDISWLLERCNHPLVKTHPDVLCALGKLHISGKKRVDYEKALTAFHAASDKGHAGAKAELSWLYFAGWGVREDIPLARQLAIEAANKGNKLGMYYAGVYLQNGDLTHAKKWYQQCADLKFVPCQNRLDSLNKLKN